MINVAIIGGPSSGKTVLTLNAGARLRVNNIDARLVQEYATDYLIRFEEIKDVHEQALIMYWAEDAETRVARSQRCEVLLCESPAFSGMPYIYLARDSAIKEYGEGKYLNLLKKMGAFARSTIGKFDLIFYLEPDFDLVPDEVRTQKSEEEKIETADKILAYCKLECPHFIRVSKEGREERVIDLIKTALTSKK